MISFTLSSRSTSEGLHEGSAFGMIRSVSSSILLLTRVMQVVNLAFGFVLYLLDVSNGVVVGRQAGAGLFDLGRLGIRLGGPWVSLICVGLPFRVCNPSVCRSVGLRLRSPLPQCLSFGMRL